MIALVLLLYASALLYDLFTSPAPVSKRTKAVYFSLMGISFVVQALHCLDVPIPSPTEAIVQVLDALFPIQG